MTPSRANLYLLCSLPNGRIPTFVCVVERRLRLQIENITVEIAATASTNNVPARRSRYHTWASMHQFELTTAVMPS